MPRRHANTLPELLVALVIMAVLAALAIPQTAATLDRAAVAAATREVEALFASARAEAIARRAPVAVLLDTVQGVVRVASPTGVIQSRFLTAIHHVSLGATRDSMSFDARGLGRGAANLTVAIARGTARDSIVVSRLGRVRE